MVLLDICRQIRDASTPESPTPLFIPTPAANSLVAYAASFNSRAYEDPLRGSIFLKHLLDYLPRKEDVVSVIGAVQVRGTQTTLWRIEAMLVRVSTSQ